MSFLALIATGTGILGVIWIRQTLQATRDTVKAAMAAVGAERAWMTVAGTKITKAENSIYNGQPVALMYGVSIRWVNDGRSPAVNSVATVIPRYSATVPVFDIKPRTDGKAIVGPGREVNTPPIWLSAEECEAINCRRHTMFIYARFDYQDVFDSTARRHTEGAYEVEILRTEDNWIAVNLSAVGLQNSAI